MQNDMSQVAETASFLNRQIASPPTVGILTGTGLGDSVASLNVSSSIEYADIPHFPLSTVQSHPGRMLQGTIKDRSVLVLQGRFHLYEGYSPAAVAFPVRVMRKMGVRLLVVTNASGGVNPGFSPGDIMIIADHVNLTGENPLIGPNDDRWGPRFPDMSSAYDSPLRTTAARAAEKHRIPFQKGIYAGLKGPSLETPSEIRFLRTIGADAVGFSTVVEVIAAIHCGMNVLGLSTITNVHDPDDPTPATVEEIIETANAAAPSIDKIIRDVVNYR